MGSLLFHQLYHSWRKFYSRYLVQKSLWHNPPHNRILPGSLKIAYNVLKSKRNITRTWQRKREDQTFHQNLKWWESLLKKMQICQNARKRKIPRTVPVSLGKAIPDDIISAAGWTLRKWAGPQSTRQLISFFYRESRCSFLPRITATFQAPGRLQTLTNHS